MLLDAHLDRTNGAPAPHTKPSHSVPADAGAKRRNPDEGDELPKLGYLEWGLCVRLLATALRDQLVTIAPVLIREDESRARMFGLLIQWNLSGLEVRELRNDALSWLFTATPKEIDRMGARIVALTTPGASMLASSILEALQQRRQTLLR